MAAAGAGMYDGPYQVQEWASSIFRVQEEADELFHKILSRIQVNSTDHVSITDVSADGMRTPVI